MKNRNLTAKEQFMLNYLKDRKEKFISPTEIGNAYKTGAHSSTASPVLLRLLERGMVERNSQGHYKYFDMKDIM